jgi:glycosyltransferase involved in cell wall biosynthesis
MTNTSSSAAPKVSVIIPAYNTANLIANCLDSVFAQTFRDFEVIVVNDGSPDTIQLEQALQPYRSRVVYIPQENKRAAGARNTAIGKARGEFLAFLDSDDSWLPVHLAIQIKLLEDDPSLGLVYADAFQVNHSAPETTFMKNCPSEGSATFEAIVVERCQIPVSTVVARKSAIVKAGLFDETLARCDDYDMWLRTAFFGARIAYSRKPQARLYLGRPDSLGQSRSKMMEAYWKILEKAAKTLPLSAEQRSVVENRAAEIRARHLIEQGKVQLRQQHPEKARELFAEANSHLHTLKLSIAVRSLQLAPRSASRLIAVWNRFSGAGRYDDVVA